jgi:hypothetical protein
LDDLTPNESQAPASASEPPPERRTGQIDESAVSGFTASSEESSERVRADHVVVNELAYDLKPAPASHPLPFQRPADYYSDSETRLRPLFPRWVPLGCGWISLVFVVLLFAAGAFAPRSGAILDWVFGKLEEDLVHSFSADVTAAQKKDFAAEMETMRSAARSGRLKLDSTQKFLKLATEVDGDDKVDHAEADKLIGAVREVNRGVK